MSTIAIFLLSVWSIWKNTNQDSPVETMDEFDEDKNLAPYAGRWVARVRGKIVAQGATADEAERSARKNRPKDIPEISFVPQPEDKLADPIFPIIIDAFSQDLDLYLVGGAVRDIFLHRNTHDLDLLVSRDGIKAAKKVAKALNAAFFPLDPQNDIGRVILTNADGTRTSLDFSCLRGAMLLEDLLARDFSINAMAINLRNRHLEDPVGGMVDLREKRLRACSKDSISSDPLRIIRAIRLAADLGFTIEKDTRVLLKESVGLLPGISIERIRDEIFRIFNGTKPSAAIRSLDMLGALPFIFPELLDIKKVQQPTPHVYDVWNHAMKAMDYMESFFDLIGEGLDSSKATDFLTGLLTMKLGRFRSHFAEHFKVDPNAERTRRAVLMYSTLYHDVGKPRKMEMENDRIRFHGHDEEGSLIAVHRAIKLRLSNAEIDRIKIIIRNHMRLVYHISRMDGEGKIPTRRAIYRFFRDVGDTGVDLCLLALADQRATYDNEIAQKTWTSCLDVVSLFLENWWEKPEETISPPSLLNGDELMAALHIRSGPFIGRAMESIREGQATGAINSRDDAISLARKLLAAEGSQG
jgi:tRNA nucleotidyltransferase/poly(A) polymerase